MKRLACWATFLLVSLLVTHAGFAAQSTADVPATKAMKESLRAEILGVSSGSGVATEEYVIGHGDLLGVSVYGEGDMAAAHASRQARPGDTTPGGGAVPADQQGGVRVMMDGRISLLHIGDVEVVGMTLTQLADYLKKLYATIYDSPIVTTTLVQSNSLRYTVMGKVTSPGVFYLDYPVTVVQAIARGGGFTEWASKKLTVIRDSLKPGDESLFDGNKLEFDYDRFISGRDLQKNVLLRSGDIIIVD
ncbi:polysaccharide biosynthesis/export family protein [bacterium]|nr:polysaccharide biosynthesis/export family protein [bacterium]